ncbi:MAG TPA: hypothetical protein VMW50_09135 [Dehalococcoidia bacterium]|nr:hypothetical protein [Dehalococcoidia bacterium]
MPRKYASIADYCSANPIPTHHQKAGEKVASRQGVLSVGWAWKPDAETKRALSRSARKFRKAKAAKLNEENGVREMATNKSVSKKTATKKVSKKVAKKVVSKKGAAKKVAVKKESNLLPLKKICQELKIDPKMARRKLRAEGVKSHDQKARWEFTVAQAKKIKEILAA